MSKDNQEEKNDINVSASVEKEEISNTSSEEILDNPIDGNDSTEKISEENIEKDVKPELEKEIELEKELEPEKELEEQEEIESVLLEKESTDSNLEEDVNTTKEDSQQNNNSLVCSKEKSEDESDEVDSNDDIVDEKKEEVKEEVLEPELPEPEEEKTESELVHIEKEAVGTQLMPEDKFEISKNDSKELTSIKNDKKPSNKALKIVLLIVAIIAVAGSAVGFISLTNKKNMMELVDVDTIYPNIFIEEVDISGLTKEEAIKKVTEKMESLDSEKNIVLNKGDKKFEYPFSDFSPTYNIKEMVEKAYSYAREGEEELKDRYNKIISLENKPYKLTLEYNYNQKLADEIMNTIYNELYVAPVNATIRRENKQFFITDEAQGEEIDIVAATKELQEIVAKAEGGTININSNVLEPKYRAADFENAKDLIGEFSTSYAGSPAEGRIINMQTAADKINNYVVYPGEIFSTGKTFGPSTYENGYRNAPVIVGGVLEEGMGGGVCQISSTLYYALLKSELEIVERRNHSQKVGYMDWGYDATIAGDYIDLKFKNDTDLPVIIESELTGNKVVVRVFGKEIHDSSRELVFSSSLVGTIPPQAEKIINNSSFPSGYRETKVSAKTGYKYNLYKTVYENGAQVENTLVNTSTYSARRAEVIVGTGAAAVRTPPSNPNPPVSSNVESTADPVEQINSPPATEPDPVEPVAGA